ncbi:putative membrane protein [Paraburkholderia youngii]
MHQFNGNPAILGVIGVIVAIKPQWPTALLLPIVNTILLYLFVLRF